MENGHVSLEDNSRRIVLFGPPGAGKGTQGALLADAFDLSHLSTGDIFRRAIAKRTELGLKVEGILSAGDLVPDELVLAVIEEALESSVTKGGFVLDGFPRTVEQAVKLDLVLSRIGRPITHVVVIEVPEEELLSRLLKRGAASNSARADDSLGVIKRRLEVYRQQTQPVAAFYNESGRAVFVKGTGEITLVAKLIHEAVSR